jgi:hypothetical protein
MSYVKLKIEVNGRDELVEFTYMNFRQSILMRKFEDRVILYEGGITREMDRKAFKDYLVAVISMLDWEDQKEILDTMAELASR